MWKSDDHRFSHPRFPRWDTGDGNIILAHLGGWKCKEIIERFHIVRKDRKSRFHLGFTEKAAFKVKIKKLIQI